MAKKKILNLFWGNMSQDHNQTIFFYLGLVVRRPTQHIKCIAAELRNPLFMEKERVVSMKVWFESANIIWNIQYINNISGGSFYVWTQGLKNKFSP